MKHIIITIIAVVMCSNLFAQDFDMNMIKEGSKIYIEGRKKADAKHMQRRLENMGYWKIVHDKKDADFIVRVTGHHAWINVYKARVEFIDRASGKSFYRSKKVNTWTRFTFTSRKAAIKKLVRKRIKRQFHLKKASYYPV